MKIFSPVSRKVESEESLFQRCMSGTDCLVETGGVMDFRSVRHYVRRACFYYLWRDWFRHYSAVQAGRVVDRGGVSGNFGSDWARC